MPIAGDVAHLITMIKVMVLWLINDYEDEDLRERCREIVDNLDKLSNINRLKELRLFSPEDIFELFQIYSGIPTTLLKYSSLEKVRCSNFCVIQKDDGSVEFSFRVKMGAIV